MRIGKFLLAVPLALGGSFMLSAPALAGDISTKSKIDAITVFPSGAEITRTVKVKLEAGEHTLLVDDVTGQAAPASLRVEAASTGKLEVGSVDARKISLASTDPTVAQSARKKLTDQIEKLQDEKEEQNNIIHVAEAERAYLQNLSKLPQTSGVGTASGVHEDWNALFGVISSHSADVAKTVTAAKLRQRKIDREIKDLRKEYETAEGRPEDRTQVRVYVHADAPQEATLSIRYQVGAASWTAFYDARLTTGDKDKGAASTLAITRRASIAQTTGEDWEDVALALSTTRPGTATAAPDLNMLSVDFGSGAAPAGGMSSNYDRMAQQSGPVSKTADGDLEENKRVLFKAKKWFAASERAAQQPVAASTFQTVYAIPGRTTIKTTGEAKRLQISAENVEPMLLVRAVPRLDHTAYLYAKFNLAKSSSPVLPGQVSLFRDGVFVGSGAFPQLAPGEDFELGFGADERVKVRRIVTEDKKGETGTFTTSRVEERRYAIMIKNLHSRAIQLQVVDRAPVAMHQDIKVEFTVDKGPQPTEKDVNDKRGTMLWEMKAEPDEEKTLSFGYKVSAPADKSIGYKELTEEQSQANQIMAK
jgi:uncharacterized protein (TIGR02231 family)